MRFLKVVPALKVQMSVWGVLVGPYGFSAVRVSFSRDTAKPAALLVL